MYEKGEPDVRLEEMCSYRGWKIKKDAAASFFSWLFLQDRESLVANQ